MTLKQLKKHKILLIIIFLIAFITTIFLITNNDKTSASYANGERCPACTASGTSGTLQLESSTPATCYDEGLNVFRCSNPNCYAKTFNEYLPALGHNYVYDNTKQPDRSGHVMKCARCNGYSSEAHTMIAATCTTREHCSVCNYNDGNTKPALGHNYGAWQQNGIQGHMRTCTRTGCGYVEKQGHGTATAATCTEGGKCPTCNYELTSALRHNYVYDNTKQADRNGHVTKCTRCNSYSTEAHTLTPATSTTPEQCSVCKYTDESMDPALEEQHNYVYDDTKQADKSGHITKCTICGAYSTEEHKIIPATCTKEGKCAVCNYTDSNLAALGHNFEEIYEKNDTHHIYKCSRCEKERAEAHDWRFPNWSKSLNGKHERICEKCGPIGSHDPVARKIIEKNSMRHVVECECGLKDDSAHDIDYSNGTCKVCKYKLGSGWHKWGAWHPLGVDRCARNCEHSLCTDTETKLHRYASYQILNDSCAPMCSDCGYYNKDSFELHDYNNEGICSRCKKRVDDHKHFWSNWELKDENCIRTCKDCQMSETHLFTEGEFEDIDGMICRKICSKCDNTKDVRHVMNVTGKKCENCGHVFKDVVSWSLWKYGGDYCYRIRLTGEREEKEHRFNRLYAIYAEGCAPMCLDCGYVKMSSFESHTFNYNDICSRCGLYKRELPLLGSTIKYDIEKHWIEYKTDEGVFVMEGSASAHIYEKWTDNKDGTHSSTCIYEDCKYVATRRHEFREGKCLDCGTEEKNNELCEHDYNTVRSDDVIHWVACTKCNAEKDDSQEYHILEDWKDNSDGTHFAICTFEGCEKKIVKAHEFENDVCKQCKAKKMVYNKTENNKENNVVVNNEDNTVANKEIPKTGKIITTSVFTLLAVVGIIGFIKLRKYNDV